MSSNKRFSQSKLTLKFCKSRVDSMTEPNSVRFSVSDAVTLVGTPAVEKKESDMYTMEEDLLDTEDQAWDAPKCKIWASLFNCRN